MNHTIALVRALGALNVVVADGPNFAERLSDATSDGSPSSGCLRCSPIRAQ